MFKWIRGLFRKKDVHPVHVATSPVFHREVLVGDVVDALKDYPRTRQVDCVVDGGTETYHVVSIEFSDGRARLWVRPR